LPWQAPLAWRARARFLAETRGLTDADRQSAKACEATAVERAEARSALYK